MSQKSTAELIADYFASGALPGLPTGHLIDGHFVPAASGATMQSFDPGNGRVFAEFAAGDAQDVARAVESASRGFQLWRHARPAERSRVLNQMAALLREHAAYLSVVEAIDSGKTLAEAEGDVAASARLFEYYAGAADKLEGISIPLGPDYMSWTLREPVGVTAHIIPWNYPTSTFARGVAPAIAAGCSVVAKPAETTPFTALLMGRLLCEAGLPPGVVNVITGLGSAVGEPLATHPQVAHVTFTGSVGTGVRVMQQVAPNVTRLTLELGGKSPLVALDDCDVEAAAEGALSAIFCNAGQVCSAGSRLVVSRAIHAELMQRLLEKTRALTLGHGLRNPHMGALNSALHLERVKGHVDRARARGCAIVAGGNVTHDPATGTGWFFEPTIIDGLATDDAAVQQEIFGPVLAVQVVDSDEAALAAANATDYGLIAGVYSRDIGRALRMARDLDAGQVSINEYWAGGVELPFGGNRKSGFGKEKGLEGLSAYLRTKCITARI
jgi:aldehyde dehydrogenase (NAD+)/betaine-aldehyde dehydrogenase